MADFVDSDADASWGYTQNAGYDASRDTDADTGSLPEIDPAEIEFDEKIGEGSYGQVFSGKCRGKDVAIKVFKPNMFQTPEERQAVREEVRIMSKIFHPNVVLFMGACTLEGNNIMIVSEKLPTDLETLLIRERKTIPLLTRMKMAKDAALGMNWLHSSNPIFIHRDLKLSNLLVDNSYKVCVCDFGLAQTKPRDVDNLEYDPHGSPLYMAPEVFIGDYNEKCDVYSFGVVLWEIFTQRQAFEQVSDNLPAFIHAVCDEGLRPEIPEDCPGCISRLLEDCWQKDATKRPSFRRIVDMMDDIMVDITLNDRDAKKLWMTNFQGKEQVSWEDFKYALCDRLGINDPEPDNIQFKCLEAVLAEKPKDIISKDSVVNLELFGKVIAWFGPLSTLLYKVESVLSQRWFHGDLLTSEAEDRLNGQPKGTFLIRFSTSSPGCFTISSINKNKKLTHQRVTHVPGRGFTFWDTHYEDLRALIKGERKKQFFVQPCPGSRYQKLFPKKPSKKEKAPEPEGGAYIVERPAGKR